MVTDAAGTGFEIKKPHKGTETKMGNYINLPHLHLKLRNPIRGRKLIICFVHFAKLIFEIKKPHKGTETSADMPLIVTLIDLKLRNPIRGRKLLA